MNLTEDAQIAEAALPVSELKRHLRMGSGFAEDDLQDQVLVSFLRAAIAVIEARTQKSLISRSFRAEIFDTPRGGRLTVPLAPITALTEVIRIDAQGAEEVQPLTDFRLLADAHLPIILRMAGDWPSLGTGWHYRIRVVAGYGPGWGDMPADLAHAVMLLAAHYYEYRSETGLDDVAMPFGVTALLSRYRALRLGSRY